MPSVGAVTSNLNATVKSGAYTAAANDLVLVDATTGPVTITVPAAPLVNTLIAVKKIDTSGNLVTVVPASGFIDSDTSVGLFSVGSTVTLQFDGSRWRLVSTGLTNVGAVSVLPRAGTAGQVLTKSSAADYDTSWATAAAPAGSSLPAWSVSGGRVFVAPPITAATAAAAPNSNSSTYGLFAPLRIPIACTLVSVSVFLTAGGFGGYTLNMGLYSDVPSAASMGPGVRLAGGSTAFNNTGFAPTTIPLNYTVTAPSTFWMCFGCPQGFPSVICYAAGTAPVSFLSGGLNTYSNAATTALQTVRYSAAVDATATAANVSANTMSTLAGSVPIFAFTIA